VSTFKDERSAKEDQFKYKEHIEECAKRWENFSDREKAFLYQGIAFKESEDFVWWWDTLKAIEKEFGINPWGIAKEQQWKHKYEHGQRMAKKFKTHGCKDLYDAYNSTFEGLVDAEWVECNDSAFQKHNHKCPCYEPLKELGKTDEEIAEMAPLFCLADQAIMTGFNPELEVFAQPRLLCKGDTHCTYRWEDRRKDKNK